MFEVLTRAAAQTFEAAIIDAIAGGRDSRGGVIEMYWRDCGRRVEDITEALGARGSAREPWPTLNEKLYAKIEAGRDRRSKASTRIFVLYLDGITDACRGLTESAAEYLRVEDITEALWGTQEVRLLTQMERRIFLNL